MRRFGLRVVVVSSLLSAACGGNSGNPAQNTQGINLQIGSISAAAERTTDGLRYRVSFQLRETSGTTGATINAVLLDFSAQGQALLRITTADPFTPMQITAGGSLGSREFAINHAGGVRVPDQVNVIIDYTDNRGGTGRVTQLGNVTAPGTAGEPPPGPCTPGPGGTCMSASSLSATCSVLANRFDMECTGIVQMVVNTPITSGFMTVRVWVGGGMDATIVVLPNTAPGAITVQIPRTVMPVGCGVSGPRNVLLNVSDGPLGPSGRTLWGNDVAGNVTCNNN